MNNKVRLQTGHLHFQVELAESLNPSAACWQHLCLIIAVLVDLMAAAAFKLCLHSSGTEGKLLFCFLFYFTGPSARPRSSGERAEVRFGKWLQAHLKPLKSFALGLWCSHRQLQTDPKHSQIHIYYPAIFNVVRRSPSKFSSLSYFSFSALPEVAMITRQKGNEHFLGNGARRSYYKQQQKQRTKKTTSGEWLYLSGAFHYEFWELFKRFDL